MTILNTPPLAPTPTPTPPVPGDNTAVIVGLIDPDLIPTAPGDSGGCPELCDTWDGATASSLANPPGSGWEYTKVIAEMNAAKGQPFSGATLDDILGTSNAATPSVIVGLVVIAAAIAALVRHRGTSPTVTAETEV
ncbi:MAG: hypothetical protein KDB26_05700 [Microthrixaceae bacterium]|nr:hypothetical protein [Microthrixaceae bacterium]